LYLIAYRTTYIMSRATQPCNMVLGSI